jgi:Peptidase_C39 like family
MNHAPRAGMAALAAAILVAGAAVVVEGNRHTGTTERPPLTAAALPARPAETPTPSPTHSAGPPGAYRLKLKGQYQWTNYYCEPASASMSLATFGIKVDQNKLARKMKTRRVGGTLGDDAANVMEHYIHSRHYSDTIVTDVAGHPRALMSKIVYDVGTLHRAPVLQVYMERLPWNSGRGYGRKVAHAIVAYGYRTSNGTITVYDPWRPTGGTHTLPAKTLAKALQPSGGMHYIERY